MKKLLMLLASIFAIVMLSGCGEETAGEKLDNALDSSKEASKDALDSAKKVFD